MDNRQLKRRISQRTFSPGFPIVFPFSFHLAFLFFPLQFLLSCPISTIQKISSGILSSLHITKIFSEEKEKYEIHLKMKSVKIVNSGRTAGPLTDYLEKRHQHSLSSHHREKWLHHLYKEGRTPCLPLFYKLAHERISYKIESL